MLRLAVCSATHRSNIFKDFIFVYAYVCPGECTCVQVPEEAIGFSQSWNQKVVSHLWALTTKLRSSEGPQCSYPLSMSPAPWTLNFYQMNIHPHPVDFLFNLVFLIETPQSDMTPFAYSCLLPFY